MVVEGRFGHIEPFCCLERLGGMDQEFILVRNKPFYFSFSYLQKIPPHHQIQQ